MASIGLLLRFRPQSVRFDSGERISKLLCLMIECNGTKTRHTKECLNVDFALNPSRNVTHLDLDECFHCSLGCWRRTVHETTG